MWAFLVCLILNAPRRAPLAERPRTTLTAPPWRRNGRPRDGHGPNFMRVIVVLVRAGMGRVLASDSVFLKREVVAYIRGVGAGEQSPQTFRGDAMIRRATYIKTR